MNHYPNCPACQSKFTYQDGEMYVCPDCQNEWPQNVSETLPIEDGLIRDAHGNILTAGDFITVIKDLKIKGSSSAVKVGTKVKIIRLLDGDHDIDCKIEGLGAIQLKSKFVKKV